MSNCVVLNKPQKVNIIDWSFQHPNCDALILRDEGDNTEMYIIAYSLNESGNAELQSMSDSNEYAVFGGIDSSMLSYAGGIR